MAKVNLDLVKCLIICNDQSSARNIKTVIFKAGINSHNLWMDDDPNYCLDILKRESIELVIVNWLDDPQVKENILRIIYAASALNPYKILFIVQQLDHIDKKYVKKFPLLEYVTVPYDARVLIKLVRALMNSQSTNVEAVLGHIEFHLQTENYAAAIAVAEDFIKANPRDASGPFYLGKACAAKGETVQATRLFEQALALDSEHILVKEKLAELYLVQGQNSKAEAILLNLPVFGDQEVKRNIALGKIFMAKGDLASAKQFLAEALAADAGSPDVEEFHGMYYFQTGDIEKAKALFGEHGTESNKLAKNFNNMAINHIKKGQFATGIKVYQNAIRVMPDQSKHHLLYFNIGMALLRCKKGQQAAQYFEKALQFDPDYEKAKKYLQQIRERSGPKPQPS